MEQATPDDKPQAPKPTNWYSGWRLFATTAATVVAAKLIGLLGTVVAVVLFLWLQPKRGTGLALAASAVAGVVAAVVYSAVLLPHLGGGSPPQQTSEPVQQQAPAPENGQWIPAPPNLKPFHGKLDGEK